MCFPARQYFPDFDEVEAPSELPYFVFDEIGQISYNPIHIFCQKQALVRYFREQIVSYDDG